MKILLIVFLWCILFSGYLFSQTINSIADSGPGTLRQAIMDAVAGEAIGFDPAVFPPSNPATITLLSPLPPITQDNLTIDASNAGVILDGSALSAGIGFYITSDSNFIKGFQIQSFPDAGIQLENGANHNTIGGNRTIGTGPNGEGNLISGNSNRGIGIAGDGTNNNIVIGNYIGTNINGTTAIPNGGDGITITAGAKFNIIGGNTPGERNIISGNISNGIFLADVGTESNIIKGNYIGTNVSGTSALGNQNAGIILAIGSKQNIIGGDLPTERNIISGNGEGIGFFNIGTDNNFVLGNYIGTDVNGTTAIPNAGHGISIGEGKFNTIGGISENERNIISGNSQNGIGISSIEAEYNTIIGNYIGVDKTGTNILSNGQNGVEIWGGAKHNTIGGGLPGEGNIISGNTQFGIAFSNEGTDSNFVKGNYIGTDVSGTSALGNQNTGIILANGSKQSIIGGDLPAERNIISGNTGNGISIFDVGTDSNIVKGNYIGVDISGTIALANGSNGVQIFNGAKYNQIGGDTISSANIIAFNNNNGVEVSDIETNFNRITHNSIFSNSGFGIDLTNGSNSEISSPIINLFNGLSVVGTAEPNAIIEIFADAEDEGKIFIDTTIVDGSNNFTKDLDLSGIPAGYNLTATQYLANNTSEFSNPLAIPRFYFAKITTDTVVNDGGTSFGCGWADYDNDGNLDLFVANGNGENNFLYHNNGDDSFTKITDGEIVNDGGTSVGCTWGDYNNDGYLDLFVANYSGENNFLYHNDGDGSFTKITAVDVDIIHDGGTSVSGSWGDYDNDGYLDLFVANMNGENNNLYHNNGDGSFQRITDSVIVTDGGNSTIGGWSDYDDDGYLDLFVANRGPENNFLYHNDGDGNFTKINDRVLVNDGGSSGGICWGDFNNDSYLDLFVTNRNDENNFFYKNNGDGTFMKITDGNIVNDGGDSRGCTSIDYDNDGDLDLFVVNSGNQNNFLYVNTGDGNFNFNRIFQGDITNNVGYSEGCIAGDFDNNGFLDLFVTNPDDNNNLFMNNGSDNHWINIKCIGTYSNRSAIGAKVKLEAFIFGKSYWQMREISASNGRGSHNSLNVEFGLGDATIIDWITIVWPSGLVWDTANVAVNQFLAITEQNVDPTPAHIFVDITSISLTLNTSYNFEVTITDDEFEIETARLLVRQGGKTNYSELNLNKAQNDIWTTNIPANQITERGIEYYIEATHGGRITTFPEAGANKPVVSSVNVPVLNFPQLTLREAYQMVSLPTNTNNQNLQNILQDDLGSYDNTQYRIFDWNQSQGKYVELSGLNITLPPGKALWLITLERKSLDIEGAQSVRTGSNYLIALNQGWNMIGNPFAFLVSWSDVDASGIQGGTLYFYDGTEWVFASTLEPFKGYAAYAISNVTLNIPPTEAGTTMRPQQSIQFSENEWQIQIHALKGNFKDEYNFAGVHKEAENEWDKLDLPEPPPIGKYVSILFEHKNWGMHSGAYTGDYRKQDEEGYIFDFTVSSNFPGQTTITLEPQNLTSKYDWAVVSQVTGVNYNKENINTLLNKQNFKLLVGNTEFIDNALIGYKEIPKEYSLSQNYPNPFNPTTTIPYQLPTSGKIKMQVYNILGQLVTTLINEHKMAGYYKQVWNISLGNKSIASGLYILSLKTDGDDGSRFIKNIKLLVVK